MPRTNGLSDSNRKAERRALQAAHNRGAHREAPHPRCPTCKAGVSASRRSQQRPDET